MAKEFYVMDDESVVGVGEAPYIFKVMVEIYLNKLASLADPENKLIFRVTAWCWDADMDRKKRLAGIRYYPLRKKLTKIVNKVEQPYKVFNQKDVIEALDKTIQTMLNSEDFKDEVKDTLLNYCPDCKRMLGWDGSCVCKPTEEVNDAEAEK